MIKLYKESMLPG